MTDPLISDANNISSTSSPKIRTFAQHAAQRIVDADAEIKALSDRIAALEGASTPAPTPTTIRFGFSPSTPMIKPIDQQVAEFVRVGAKCPRIYASDTNTQACILGGITTWYAWMDKSATVAQGVAYLQKYKGLCLGLEIGNELNLDVAWTAKLVADKQIAFMDAARAAGGGLEQFVMLSSIGNNISKVEGLSMLDWGKALNSFGCSPGKGFTINNYHNYGVDPQVQEEWQEISTPGRHGTCLQAIWGHPPFAVTEFGAKIGWTGVDETTQQQAAAAWPAFLKKIPECVAGHWFEVFDGFGGGGFGLIRSDGSHRPSYDSYKAAIA